MAQPRNLRVEHLGADALGIGVRRPRLSWWLPDGAREQLAYRIVAGTWDSGRVESRDSVLVAWPANRSGLASASSGGSKVVDRPGESEWSEPAWFEAGLLDAGGLGRALDRAVRAGSAPTRGTTCVRPAPATFDVDTTSARRAPLRDRARHLRDLPQRAAASATSSSHPGFTSLRRQPRTSRPTTSPDCSSARDEPLGRGAERRLVPRAHTGSGRSPTATATPSPSSASCTSATRVVATGERLAVVPPARSSPPTSWPARSRTVRSQPDGVAPGRRRRPRPARAHVSPAPPIRRVAGDAARSPSRRLDPDRQVVDLGQNINGWVRLARPRPRGHRRSRSCTARRSTPTAT